MGHPIQSVLFRCGVFKPAIMRLVSEGILELKAANPDGNDDQRSPGNLPRFMLKQAFCRILQLDPFVPIKNPVLPPAERVCGAPNMILVESFGSCVYPMVF